jgi:hypothetical protein
MTKEEILADIRESLFPTLLVSLWQLKRVNGRVEWTMLRCMFPSEQGVKKAEKLSKDNTWVVKVVFKQTTKAIFWKGDMLPPEITDADLLSLQKE